jgi:hypothetical protein
MSSLFIFDISINKFNLEVTTQPVLCTSYSHEDYKHGLLIYTKDTPEYNKEYWNNWKDLYISNPYILGWEFNYNTIVLIEKPKINTIPALLHVDSSTYKMIVVTKGKYIIVQYNYKFKKNITCDTFPINHNVLAIYQKPCNTNNCIIV